MKWGLSVLDWCSHAIDERAHRPTGVYKAECGHLLMMVVTLHEEPNGKACPPCSAGPAQAAQDNNEVRGYFVGECGHPRPLVGDSSFWVGPCNECEASAT